MSQKHYYTLDRFHILLNTIVVMVKGGLIDMFEMLNFNFSHIFILRWEWLYEENEKLQRNICDNCIYDKFFKII